MVFGVRDPAHSPGASVSAARSGRVFLLCLTVLLGLGSLATAGDPPVTSILEGNPEWLEEQDDPARDGWDTEVLSGQAGARLAALADLIARPEPMPIADIASLVTDDVATTVLRPTDTEVVFRDRSITVSRAVAGGVTEPTRGAEQVVASLEALRRPLHAADDVHVKLKPFRIEADASGFTTHVLYAASSHGKSGALQQNARWVLRWAREPDESEPRLEEIRVEDYEEVAIRDIGHTMFTDCTRSVLKSVPTFEGQLMRGNEYWMRRMQATRGIDNFGHHGLAVGDVDGDGLEDLYVCQTGGLPNLLLIQNVDGTVRNVAATSRVDFMERTQSALLLDLDNDGDQDLVLATLASLLILANDGEARFVRMAELPILNAYSLAAADYDLDGDLDIYACNYQQRGSSDKHGGLSLQPIPYHDANNGAANALYRNDGEWRFADVTVEVGLDANNRRWSLAAGWEDYDNDGDPDLYVANDFGRNNLYRNDDGDFVDVAASAGVEDQATGMSVSWGDYNADGWMDLYVGNMFSSAGNRIAFQRAFLPGIDETTKARFQRLARGNSLFLNQGDGTFRDVSEQAAVTMGRWAWSSPFVDLNNDGWEDLVVANGYITNESTADL